MQCLSIYFYVRLLVDGKSPLEIQADHLKARKMTLPENLSLANEKMLDIQSERHLTEAAWPGTLSQKGWLSDKIGAAALERLRLIDCFLF